MISEDVKGLVAEGDSLVGRGNYPAAMEVFGRALLMAPDNPELMKKIGNCHLSVSSHQEAEAWYRKAHASDPAYFDAIYNLGCVCADQGRRKEAQDWYQKALAIHPGSYDALNNLGMVLFAEGDFDQAAVSFEKALAIQQDGFEAKVNLGNALFEQGRLVESERVYAQALVIKPESPELHVNLALTQLTLGNIKKGLEEYEWRLKLPDYAPPECGRPLWNGDPLPQGVLMLYTEQGLGDTLCFLRYVRMAAERCARVVVVTREPLRRLLETVPGIDQVLVQGQDAPPVFDAFLPVMSLPAVFKTGADTIPARVPYLKVPRQAISELVSGKGMKVGVVWSGNVEQQRNAIRSVPFDIFKEILNIPGVHFFSLQVGPRRADLAGVDGVPDLGAQVKDLADTASLIQELDLVISVDTSVAHLAGALGKPVWVLLALVADWRWGDRGDTTPWYPTARIFRQRKRNNWDMVLASLKAALAQAAGA